MIEYKITKSEIRKNVADYIGSRRLSVNSCLGLLKERDFGKEFDDCEYVSNIGADNFINEVLTNIAEIYSNNRNESVDLIDLFKRNCISTIKFRDINKSKNLEKYISNYIISFIDDLNDLGSHIEMHYNMNANEFSREEKMFCTFLIHNVYHYTDVLSNIAIEKSNKGKLSINREFMDNIVEYVNKIMLIGREIQNNVKEKSLFDKLRARKAVNSIFQNITLDDDMKLNIIDNDKIYRKYCDMNVLDMCLETLELEHDIER